MKCLIALCCVAVAVIAEEKYTSKYDGMNVDDILSNDRLLLAYFNCVMDKGKCTAEGAELKSHLPEAIETGCAKCTETQEHETSRIVKYLIENKKDLWDEAVLKFDPTGKWRKEYADRAKANGIDLS